MLHEFQDVVDPRHLPANHRHLAHYLTGVVDGQGCFTVALKRLPTSRFGYTLDPIFHVTQHASNRLVLELMRRTMDCGRIIRKHGQKDALQFYVQNRRQLKERVIPFLDEHKLLLRRDDFRTFKHIVTALEAREHWELEGFKRLLRMAFSMNGEGRRRRYRLEDVLLELETLGSHVGASSNGSAVAAP